MTHPTLRSPTSMVPAALKEAWRDSEHGCQRIQQINRPWLHRDQPRHAAKRRSHRRGTH